MNKKDWEKLTKDKVIDRALDLEMQLHAANNTPLTAATLLKKKFALVESTKEAEVDIEASKARTAEAIRAITEEGLTEQTEILTRLTIEYNGLRLAIKEVDTFLESEIAVKEIEAKEYIATINESVTLAEKEAGETIQELNEKAQDAYTASQVRITGIKENQSRELEDLTYEHKKAITQEKTEFVAEAAESMGSEVISVEELKNYKELKPASDELIKAAVGKAEGILKTRMSASHEKETITASHEAALKINTLTTEKHALTEKVGMLSTSNDILQKQVSEIPTVIKESVAAAKADVTVNNEAGKK